MGHLPTSPKRPWKPKPPPQSGRKRSNQAFYNGKRWRTTRLAFLKNNPLCIVCERQGDIKKADMVDHITPINEGGEKYDWENLQPMCHPHHNQKSGRESQAAQKKKRENGE